RSAVAAPSRRKGGKTAILLMCSSSRTRQNEQNPTARPVSSFARKQYDTPLFSSSVRYIARVHGLVNDASSIASTSSIWPADVTGSIVHARMLVLVSVD